MRTRARRMVLAGAAVAWGCGPGSGGAQSQAGTPRGLERVGEGVVSTERNQTFPVEDPRAPRLWLSEYGDSFDRQTILVARETPEGWMAPEVAPFSGTWGDRAPRFSPDGSQLYFTSNRPTAPGGAAGDMNIWRVARDGDGWTEPEPMGPPVNSPESDIHIAASDSALWIPSRRAGTLGGSDLYRVPVGASEAQHVPAPLNDERSQPDLWISPDERWMILVVTDRPGGFGGDDLWVSRSDNGTWTVPENLGSIVNTEEYEYGPSLSRDGRHLYFTSHRSGSADVYRIPLAEVLGPDRRAVGR